MTQEEDIVKINENVPKFTSWDMHNAFYAGRAISDDTNEDTRFQDLVMKYKSFEKFLIEYQKTKENR